MKSEILLNKLIKLSAWTDENLERSALLQSLIEEVKTEVRMTNAKANGKGNVQKLIEALFKGVKGTPYEEKLRYAHTCEDGKQYVTDTYRMLRFSDPLPLPEAPGYLKMNLDRAFNGCCKNTIEAPQPLEMPDLVGLKAFVKLKKAQNMEPRFDFGFGLPMVNARFLLSILEAFPDAKACCSARFETASGKNFSPIIWENENGDIAVLLPLNPKDNEKRERTAV